MKNKRGWIRIVEAFVAILLVMGIILVLLDEGQIKKQDSSEEIYEIENLILRNIQENNSLRQEVLDSELPINSSNPSFSVLINNSINKHKPSYLNCFAKICEINKNCIYENNFELDVYVRSAIISADLNEHKPKQLKLFCFRK